MLVALERRGYLQRTDTGRFTFGPKILTLANQALCSMTLREVAHPVLTGLMRCTGLAAKMAIFAQDQAVLIEQVHPPHMLAPMTWLGKRLDLHCTALGKALAAFRPSHELKGLIAEHRLARHNRNTICSPAAFLEELERTRELGYALDDEELILGARCVAVPVLGDLNEAVAAIGVAGTTAEIPDGRVESLSKLLNAAARMIREAPLAPEAKSPDGER